MAEARADVLCEKPLDVCAERVDRMLKTCDEEGVTLGGVFQNRVFEAARLATETVSGGELGDPRARGRDGEVVPVLGVLRL